MCGKSFGVGADRERLVGAHLERPAFCTLTIPWWRRVFYEAANLHIDGFRCPHAELARFTRPHGLLQKVDFFNHD
jgi:hypothetical protein